jgi:lysophospholipase L1-like esterase
METRNKQANKITVACLGSSTTAAKGTFDWIAEIRKNTKNERFDFVNLGVGGDLSYNALLRVQQVIDANPDKVLIIIGANDILAMVFENLGRIYKRWKHLPQKPSKEWFSENLVAIIQRLKKETKAEIGVASLALVGEEPHSTDPKQQQLNLLFREFADVIKEITNQENVGYIPLYEQFQQAIEASPGPSFKRFSILSFYRDYLWREFILRYSFDEIAEMNGWKFHIDGVHLNTAGGLILTEVVQEFLSRSQS